jgi:Family of unknown function (DUF6884)
MQNALRTVYLISCVGKKLPSAAPARELYASDWFQKARDYVEATNSPWFILSAEHGMISPDQVISPYERTLNTMNKAERQQWAARVKGQMESTLPNVDRIVVLAGSRYREFLMDYLRHRAATVDVPMQGLGIGKQLHYLVEARRHASM